MKTLPRLGAVLVAVVLGASTACQDASEPTTKSSAVQPSQALRGIDLEKKILRIGMLNDESGPAAAIGKPYAIGKRVLAKQVNAGKSGLLPEDWQVELIERDHGYNPGKAEQHYKEIKDRVLLIGTSFGTPNTLPLRPFLKADTMVAFPASLSSEMAEFEFTPPFGASYEMEAMRTMDWIVEKAGGAAAVKAAIVADQTDYGKDGMRGLRHAAKHHQVKIVSEQTIAPGQKDFTAVVAALKKAGATHVLLTVLPSSTGPVLATAAKMKFVPTWIGNTPSWTDAFFSHPQLPAAIFSTYHWVNGMPFWGEKVPGMDAFLDAYEKHGKQMGRPDSYILMSYLQGRVALEAAKRAITAKDASPKGYVKALRSLRSYTAGGMLQPLDLTRVPYVAGTRTRILKPDFTKKSWTVVAPYAEPESYRDRMAAAE